MIYILGPCVIESRAHAMECALAIKDIVGDRDWYFKASYDKANRSSIGSYRGPGLVEGMDILQEVKAAAGCKVMSDVHTVQEVACVTDVLNMIQIPAFLCRQTDLLVAAGETGLPVNIKKGQFMTPGQMKYAVEKADRSVAPVYVTERGTCFGYGDLVVDFRGIPIMRKFAPVIFDATHSAQKPGGETTGGAREFIPAMVRAAKAVGVEGLFIECHPDPDKALSDAATQWPISKLAELL